jgi:DNA-binding beta-propeller fold protein YncE
MRLSYIFSSLACAALLSAATAGQAAAPAYHVVDRIAGPDGGWDYVRVDNRTSQVLVTRGTAVMAVSTLTGKMNPSFARGTRLHIALPVGDGSELLLTNGTGDTAVFADARTGATLATVPTGRNPDAAVYDPKSGLVLVVDHSGGDVVVIDARTRKRLGAIEVGGALEEAVTDGHGRGFVNVEDKNEIAVLDLAARKVTGRYALPGCDGPTGLAYDARDGLLIAACDGATLLVAAADGKVVDTLATGKGADGVAFDPARRLAFVPAGDDGVMSVIAIAGGHGRVVQQVETHKSARTIGLDERTGRLYLPSADFLPAVAGARAQVKPGSFRLLVVAP